jgi:ComEC/Rec2-related protein
MIATIFSHLTLFNLKNIMQQIRLPWSSYAVFGAIIGACAPIKTLMLTLCIALILTIFLFKQKFKFINIASFLACVIIAAGSSYYQTQKIACFYEHYAQQKLTISGEIIDLDSLVLNPSKRVIKILVHQIAPDSQAPTTVTIWANNTNQLQLHDLVLLTNLETPNWPTQTLFTTCLRADSVQLKLTKNSTYKILSRPKYNQSNYLNFSALNLIQQKIYTLKYLLLSKLKLKLTPTGFNLLATIFLGHKKAGNPQDTQLIRDQFQVWGLAHFLARAGLHMIMIALLIKLLLLLLQVPVRLSSPIIIALVLIYHQLSWPSVSFLRALHMVIIYETCKLLNLQIDGLHLLNLILIGTLLSNPVQILFLDFQLSFALTYALVLAFRQNQYRNIAPNTICPV